MFRKLNPSDRERHAWFKRPRLGDTTKPHWILCKQKGSRRWNWYPILYVENVPRKLLALPRMG